MNGTVGYAVFFFPQALEALGDVIKPYLVEQPGGPHLLCSEIDTGGAFVEMTLIGKSAEGKDVQVELMVPSQMIRLIVSAQNDAAIGFGPREKTAAG